MQNSLIKALPEEKLLIQLAEECAEASQAALKLVRALNGDTPVGEPECRTHLLEEMADVSLCIEMVTTAADRVRIRAIRQRKKKRWEDRIEQETEIHGSV